MFQLSWTIEGEKQLSRNLRGISETMGDWEPAFKKIAKDLKDVFSNDVFFKGSSDRGKLEAIKSKIFGSKKEARIFSGSIS